VRKIGTAVIPLRELQSHLEKNNCKIFPPSELAEYVNIVKTKKNTVGFTNGCFDLIHLGHLQSLAEARSHCDILIVGVNGDSSVKRLKGNSRPIQDEKTRASIVASLEFVDAVVLFDDDTAENIVDMVKPDVIMKDGYSIENWPEAKMVISYGGEVVTLKKIEGYSTTNLIEKIKND
jgi:D-beta-D-heptose 7-phosphate kinase/D-beta-D-heptose 1-phosphate adenosyltransferase